jgi:hypothetical protein
MAEKYNSMYLGLCINNDDPQRRGRVQVFVPHVMPTMEDWNTNGEDINITCVGDNVIDSLTTDQIMRLRAVLPWAEAASPIIGASAPGNLVPTTALQAAAAIGQGYATGGVAGAVGATMGLLYNQSPVAQASVSSNNALYQKAKTFNIDRDIDYTGSLRKCGQGARGILGALTGDRHFAKGLGAGKVGGAGPASSLVNGRNSYLLDSGYFNPPASVDGSYMNDPSKWQIGDTVVNAGGGKGYGHIQVWTGTEWVSDFPQGGKILQSSNYRNFQVYRMNERGLAQVKANPLVNFNQSAADSPKGQLETDVVSSESASPTPLAQPDQRNAENPNVTSTATAAPSAASTTAATPTAPLTVNVDASGNVSPAELNRALVQRLETSSLKGYVPQDAAKYGVDGSTQSWANYLTKLVEKESYYNVNVRNDGDAGGSVGLFQVSTLDGSRYGANPTGRNWTEAQLKDPANQIETAIKIHERQVLRTGTIANSRGAGAGGYFASTSMRKIAADVAAGKIGSFDSSALPTGAVPPGATRTVARTDQHGPMAIENLNGLPKGMFSYPSAGAMLWVFFRDGNPQFPVYFATSYSQAEWSSAYNAGSPGNGLKPVPDASNPNVTSMGSIMNFNGVGGIRSTMTTNFLDHAQDEHVISLFGPDGSNMSIHNGYHQVFSKFDRRDAVEKDRFESTLGYKEEWVNGSKNIVVKGDLTIKIGDCSAEAVDAVTRIQEILAEIHKPLTESTT